MSETLFDYISNGEKSTIFGLPFTEELSGREALLANGEIVCFENEPAIKCDDDLFLAEKEGRILLIEEQEDLNIKAVDSEAIAGKNTIPEELEGWEADLSFASGYVLTAHFADGKLKLTPSPEPEIPAAYAEGRKASQAKEVTVLPDPKTFDLEIVAVGEKRFLLRFPLTGEVVFFDARRFLLYALMNGKAVTGFVEVPPKD